MNYQNLIFEKRDGIGYLTLNRPEKLNSLSTELMAELGQALDLIEDEPDIKVVIFDISCEYPFLLMDVIADPSIQSTIILENEVKDVQEFYNAVVKPKEYEDDSRVMTGMAKLTRRAELARPWNVAKPSFDRVRATPQAGVYRGLAASLWP